MCLSSAKSNASSYVRSEIQKRRNMMNTQSSPSVTAMQVIPVAGHDSMLMNIGGAHGAYFTRNIVILTDNAGHTGVGEAPGGEVILNTLLDARQRVIGEKLATLNRIV